MQIFLAHPTGAPTAYTVEATTSIQSLKAMIENQEFLPATRIRLVAANSVTPLEDGTTLAGNGIQEEDTLQVLLEVNAGMRAKWRKKRMRRLRRKRRKMRQRAR